jgi:hypothetical protein
MFFLSEWGKRTSGGSPVSMGNQDGRINICRGFTVKSSKEVKFMPCMVVMGDLNEVLYSFEKEGGRPRPN